MKSAYGTAGEEPVNSLRGAALAVGESSVIVALTRTGKRISCPMTKGFIHPTSGLNSSPEPVTRIEATSDHDGGKDRMKSDQEINKARREAYDRKVDEMVRQKQGYNGRLATKILKRLRKVYPQAIPMTERVKAHPSYHNTLVTLVEKGLIDYVIVWRTMDGRANITQKGYGMALSDAGMEKMKKQVNWNTIASIVAAVGGTIAAVTGLYVVLIASP